MTFKTWLLFLVMETALSLSPGPAVFYVVSQGARGALRRSAPAAAGIISANAIYFALSATSLGAIIAASARFFMIAKWVGAAYLIYLGVKALRSAAATHAVDLGVSLPTEKGDRRRVYLGALTLQLANPKALLFFLALLPQFIDPSAGRCPADADSGGDVDAAGVLHSIGIRVACPPRAACVQQIWHVAQHEPLARLDRGRWVARLRDPRIEIQSSRIG